MVRSSKIIGLGETCRGSLEIGQIRGGGGTSESSPYRCVTGLYRGRKVLLEECQRLLVPSFPDENFRLQRRKTPIPVGIGIGNLAQGAVYSAHGALEVPAS